MTSLLDDVRNALTNEAQQAIVKRQDPHALARRIVRRRFRKQLSISGGLFVLMVGAFVGVRIVVDASMGLPGPPTVDASKKGEDVVSPPGKKGVIFTALTADGEAQLYKADTDGGDVRQVTEGRPSRSAAWSPDGSKLVLARGSETNSRIFVMNADGSGLQPLTDGPADFSPVFSSDGETIAFVRNVGGKDDIYLVGADGSGLRRLTSASGPEIQPAWSPDGSQLAYTASNPGDGNQAIHVINADGTGDRAVVDGPGSESAPVWSPSGEKLAFAREAADSDVADLWLTSFDDSQEERLTSGEEDERPRAWIRDHILFLRGELGQWRGHVFDLSSGHSSQLIDAPIWGPDVSWRE
jgi:Tol biopolymer transport system component